MAFRVRLLQKLWNTDLAMGKGWVRCRQTLGRREYQLTDEGEQLFATQQASII